MFLTSLHFKSQNVKSEELRETDHWLSLIVLIVDIIIIMYSGTELVSTIIKSLTNWGLEHQGMVIDFPLVMATFTLVILTPHVQVHTIFRLIDNAIEFPIGGSPVIIAGNRTRIQWLQLRRQSVSLLWREDVVKRAVFRPRTRNRLASPCFELL